MTFRGRVKNGQITLEEPVSLPEGSVVDVNVSLVQGPAEPQTTVWDRLRAIAGTVEGLPPDMARNHDHYLYGTPKKP